MIAHKVIEAQVTFITVLLFTAS